MQINGRDQLEYNRGTIPNRTDQRNSIDATPNFKNGHQ